MLYRHSNCRCVVEQPSRQFSARIFGWGREAQPTQRHLCHSTPRQPPFMPVRLARQRSIEKIHSRGNVRRTFPCCNGFGSLGLPLRSKIARYPRAQAAWEICYRLISNGAGVGLSSILRIVFDVRRTRRLGAWQDVSSLEPPAQIDIGASLRAKRPKSAGLRSAAHSADPVVSRWLFRHRSPRAQIPRVLRRQHAARLSAPMRSALHRHAPPASARFPATRAR